MKSQQIQTSAELSTDFIPFTPKDPLKEEEIQKIYENKSGDDSRSLHDKDGRLSDLFGVTQAFAIGVANRETDKFPQLLTNKTGTSVSLILHCPCQDKKCESGCGSVYSSTHTYWKEFQENFVIPQFEYAYRQMFPTSDHNQPFCEIREAHGIREYKFNLTPEQLDEILIKNTGYQGYRHGSSVLLLTKQFEMKEGMVCLLPVFPIPESQKKEYFMRVEGCQFTEIPTAQLLRLLPDFSGDEPGVYNSHRAPSELANAIPYCTEVVRDVFVFMMFDQLMMKPPEGMPKEEYDPKLTEDELEEMKELQEFDNRELSLYIVRYPKKENGPLQIVPMDERAKRIYRLYGNCSDQELSQCYSLEIPVLAYLEKIYKYQEQTLARTTDPEKRSPYETSLLTLKKMIETEENRLKAKNVTPNFWKTKPAGTGKGRVVLCLNEDKMPDKEKILEITKETLTRDVELLIDCKDTKTISETLRAAGLSAPDLEKIKFIRTSELKWNESERASYTFILSNNTPESRLLGERICSADPNTRLVMNEWSLDIKEFCTKLDTLKKQYAPPDTATTHTPSSPRSSLDSKTSRN